MASTQAMDAENSHLNYSLRVNPFKRRDLSSPLFASGKQLRAPVNAMSSGASEREAPVNVMSSGANQALNRRVGQFEHRNAGIDTH